MYRQTRIQTRNMDTQKDIYNKIFEITFYICHQFTQLYDGSTVFFHNGPVSKVVERIYMYMNKDSAYYVGFLGVSAKA